MTFCACFPSFSIMFYRFIYVVLCIRTLFLFYGCVIFCFIYSSVDEHVNCFHFLAIVWGPVKLFSKVIVWFCIPTSSVWRFVSMFPNTYYLPFFFLLQSSFCSSHFLVVCPFWNLGAFVSLYPYLHFFNSGVCLAPLHFPFPTPYPRNFLKAVNQGSCRAHLIGFLSLWEHCPLLSDIQYLENPPFM